MTKLRRLAALVDVVFRPSTAAHVLLALALSPTASAQPDWFFQPNFAFGPEGTLFATEDHRIMRYAADGTKECYAGCGETPYAPGVTAQDLQFFPEINAIAADGNAVVYVKAWLDRRMGPTGELVFSRLRLVAIDRDGTVRLIQEELIQEASAFAVDPTGEFFYYQNVPFLAPAQPVARVRAEGDELAFLPDSEVFPNDFLGLYVDLRGNLWQSRIQDGRVKLKRYRPSGEISEFDFPERFDLILVQTSDPQGNLYALASVGRRESPANGWTEILRIDDMGQWETLGGVAQNLDPPNAPLILGLGPRAASDSSLQSLYLGWSPYGSLCLSLGLPRPSVFAERSQAFLDELPGALSTLGCIDNEGVIRNYFDFGFEGPFISAASNAASGVQGGFAPDSWVSLFGGLLAPALTVAETAPLPVTLGGTTPTLTDSAGIEHPVQVQFVSGGQANFLFPAAAALGTAILRITTEEVPDARHGTIEVEVTPVSPGLFSANASGRGVAAAFALRVDRSGNQTVEPIFEFNQELGRIVFRPIPLNPDLDEVHLLLFGTGIRGRGSLDSVRATVGGVEVPVSYAGPQGGFDGLDQVNIGPLPAVLKENPGEFDIEINVDGILVNVVKVGIF